MKKLLIFFLLSMIPVAGIFLAFAYVAATRQDE